MNIEELIKTAQEADRFLGEMNELCDEEFIAEITNLNWVEPEVIVDDYSGDITAAWHITSMSLYVRFKLIPIGNGLLEELKVDYNLIARTASVDREEYVAGVRNATAEQAYGAYKRLYGVQ